VVSSERPLGLEVRTWDRYRQAEQRHARDVTFAPRVMPGVMSQGIMMNDSKRKRLSQSQLITSLLAELVILVGLYYLCTTYNLPMGLGGALFLLVVFAYLTLSKFNSLDKPKKVCFVGLTLASLVLTILFAYKHFVSDISITAIHVGVIMIAPILLWKHLEKKAKKPEI